MKVELFNSSYVNFDHFYSLKTYPFHLDFKMYVKIGSLLMIEISSVSMVISPWSVRILYTNAIGIGGSWYFATNLLYGK